MRKRTIALLLGLGLLGLASQFRLVKISDNDMSPGFRPGDWVLLGPGTARKGDVVQLDDPAHPSRKLFRRVLATSGDDVRYRTGKLRVNGQTLRIREMTQQDDFAIRSEENGWLIRRRTIRDRSQGFEGIVQDDHVFLMADARDEAVDSRWWGPLKENTLGRRVWYRWGEADPWRQGGSWYGRDGPWRVPEPAAPGPNAIPSKPSGSR